MNKEFKNFIGKVLQIEFGTKNYIITNATMIELTHLPIDAKITIIGKAE